MNEHRAVSVSSHEADFYAWTQQQAKMLRALNSVLPGEYATLDLANIAEEIESLGSADLNSVRSFLRQVLVHLIRAASDPSSNAVGHWRTEATAFHLELLDRYTPSMRRSIDLEKQWQRAKRLAESALQEHGVSFHRDVVAKCPFKLQDFTGEDFSFDELVTKIRAA